MINNLSEQAAADAMQRILKMKPRPDGIFSANDTMAVACIDVLKQAGLRVSQDIAVGGFNNDPLSRVNPTLTTVPYSGYKMGEIAATTLINNIDKLPSANLNTLVLRHKLTFDNLRFRINNEYHEHAKDFMEASSSILSISFSQPEG